VKKLINDTGAVVCEMLEGIVDSSAHLALLDGSAVVVRAGLPAPEARKVAVISGGGSGHEPAHAGYVGSGMLSAAVAGDVFTSPSTDAVLDAIRAAAGPAGAVLIVKNYTGDRLNFGLAAEIASAEGIPTEVVVVADDVALRDTVSPERRRGIAGTVFVHKVAGALAEQGADLASVVDGARKASTRIGTMGVGLSSCTVPAVGKPGFALGDDEIELGLGIHGEKGVARGPMQTADALVDEMLGTIGAELALQPGERVVLLVNNLGATTAMELAIVARRALAHLRNAGLVVERVWSGPLLTALEMAGVSLSVMRVDDAVLNLLDSGTDAPAWPGTGKIAEQRQTIARPAEITSEAEPMGPLGPLLANAVASVSKALRAGRDHFTELDSRSGDGDLGISMERAAEAMAALPPEALGTPHSALLSLSRTLRRAIGGSSGPFYAVGLSRAGRRLAGIAQPSPRDWLDAFAAAVEGVEELGGAKAGDRTMVDALRPALEALRQQVEAGQRIELSAVAAAAGKGAEETANMAPRLGRASYMGARAVGSPDGGAVVAAHWLDALANVDMKR
jgi:ATP-dependent dihydroxyacetone kinase